MYKVMIVDDEKYIRKSIRNRIDWESCGLVVTAEASNGEEALSRMEEETPDLVLTDVRMPVMDGLGLIEKAKKRFSSVSYVIMSAYSDFSYAKGAIQLGVEDYVLKPVEEEELAEILKKTVVKKTEERMNRIIQEPEELLERPRLNLKRQIAGAAFYADEEEMEFRIGEALKEAVSQCSILADVYTLFDFAGSCAVFLLNGSCLNPEFQTVTERIWDKVNVPENERWAAWSDIYEAGQMQTAAREAVDLLKNKLFYPGEERIFLGKASVKEEEPEGFVRLKGVVQSSLQKIWEHREKKAQEEFLYFLDCYVNETSGVKLLEKMIEGLLLILSHMEKPKTDARFKPDGISGGTMDAHIYLHTLRRKDCLLCYGSLRELKDECRSLLKRLFSEEAKEPDLVVQIKEYIRNHYAEDMNVASLADRFYMNPNYLSNFFKEKTNLGLVGYIEAVRMERAKYYLKEGDYSVTDIASATGYADANYFSKVFKKYTGLTPRQYRKSG